MRRWHQGPGECRLTLERFLDVSRATRRIMGTVCSGRLSDSSFEMLLREVSSSSINKCSRSIDARVSPPTGDGSSSNLGWSRRGASRELRSGSDRRLSCSIVFRHRLTDVLDVREMCSTVVNAQQTPRHSLAT